MGGGPRTFPGGLNKWQWKRLHEKKASEKEKRLLDQEKQLYQASNPILNPRQTSRRRVPATAQQRYLLPITIPWLRETKSKRSPILSTEV
ncbi:unnamed protein product [Linum tenue]|uniref:Uncharacterized protein n=1 Tax=Linum tenue TaxID=586396 RepID=A0AAV0RHL8_9ROSI|nr:unnamed protein product [Linum tenue]